jgi:hypothetical protein
MSRNYAQTATPSRHPKAKQRMLVRLDYDILSDEDFARLDRSARIAYFDSLFYVAANSDTERFFPHSALADSFGDEANGIAEQLVSYGIWEFVGLGYRALPYNGCAAVLERREKIPDALRRLIYERDEYRCVICGATEDLTLDHIFPWSLGGRDTEDNLRTLCRSCNCRKGASV